MSNSLVLAEASTGNVISINSNYDGWFQPLKDLAMNFASSSTNGRRQNYFYRMRTDFASENKLVKIIQFTYYMYNPVT